MLLSTNFASPPQRGPIKMWYSRNWKLETQLFVASRQTHQRITPPRGPSSLPSERTSWLTPWQTWALRKFSAVTWPRPIADGKRGPAADCTQGAILLLGCSQELVEPVQIQARLVDYRLGSIIWTIVIIVLPLFSSQTVYLFDWHFTQCLYGGGWRIGEILIGYFIDNQYYTPQVETLQVRAQDDLLCVLLETCFNPPLALIKQIKYIQFSNLC